MWNFFWRGSRQDGVGHIVSSFGRIKKVALFEGRRKVPLFLFILFFSFGFFFFLKLGFYGGRFGKKAMVGWVGRSGTVVFFLVRCVLVVRGV